jgi:hypothetical protein
MKNKLKIKTLRTLLLLLISSGFCSIATGQAKTKEVDALYQKYKNLDSISVTNANGTVKLAVTISLNTNGKPISIVLTGYADNSEIANTIIKKLEADKEKAGFKYSSTSTQYSSEILSVSVYTKGTQYAKYGVDTDTFGKNDKPPPYETGTEEQKARREKAYYAALFGQCFIYMEVGDISRKSNGKSEDFKF